MFNLQFHHLGLATKKPDLSKKFVESLGYTALQEVEDVLQGVKAVFCTHPSGPPIEVIYSNGNPGPLDSILKAETTSFYHICYQCPNIAQAVADIKAKNLRVIEVSSPKPAILFNNRPVAFYLVNGFGLIELLEGVE